MMMQDATLEKAFAFPAHKVWQLPLLASHHRGPKVTDSSYQILVETILLP